METRRWTNPSQPQTLQMAVFLLYINAVLGFLFGSVFFRFGAILGLAALAGFAAAGFGIANEKKWGYSLGVGLAVAAAGIGIAAFLGLLNDGNVGLSIIGLLFDIALVALLVHPMSRDYQRIWFS